MLCEAEKKCTLLRNSTLMIIKIYTSTVQYIQRKQQSLSLTRYNPEIYRTYGSLQSSWECHSTVSWSIKGLNPSWYSSLKSISILLSHIHTGLLNWIFSICFPIKNLFKLPSFPRMPHSLPICHCSSISQHLTKNINYESPHYASFSSIFLCFYSKHNSHHSVLKQNQLINGKKHSPVLEVPFYVIHITHPYFNQQNGLIKKQ